MIRISPRHAVTPALLLLLVACNQIDRPLGDRQSDLDEDSGAGSGGAVGSGASAGSSAVGGTSAGGVTGTGGAVGAAGATGNAGLATCFSPRRPELALTGGEGCTCSDYAPACVATPGAPNGVLSLHCIEGRWHSVEDGVCDSLTYPGCEVDGIIYLDGVIEIPDPWGSCNKCFCERGRLGCTTIGCAGAGLCPAGTGYGMPCSLCGTVGNCLVVEHGCFPTCEDGGSCAGSCNDGICTTPVPCL
jgi:hypothetical protein